VGERREGVGGEKRKGEKRGREGRVGRKGKDNDSPNATTGHD